MEEIELKELLWYYLKKIPIIILTIILAILLGYLYMEYYQVPMYQGKTTIILIQKNDNISNDMGDTENQLNVNEKLVATYSEIIKSRRVLEQVINNLELKTTISLLEEQIDIEAIIDTSIIEITVTDKNNKKAALIANELATVFKEEVTKLYNLENVSVIDKAIIEKEPYNVNKIKQMIIYIAIGITSSCLFIFIMYYFDNSIKNKKEIETKFDLPVLGEIPIATKLLKKEKNTISTLTNKEEPKPIKKEPKLKTSTNKKEPAKRTTTNAKKKSPTNSKNKQTTNKKKTTASSKKKTSTSKGNKTTKKEGEK